MVDAEFQQSYENYLSLRKVMVLEDLEQDVRSFTNGLGSSGLSKDKVDRIMKILDE
jgi:hypothetical protein